MKTPYVKKVLQHFDIPEENLLGRGGESFVYEFDDEKILRIYKQGGNFNIDAVRRLKIFYDSLQTDGVRFSIPRIDEIDSYSGIYYSIEPLIRGEDMTSYLRRDPSEGELHHVLEEYANVASSVHRIVYNEGGYYGEVLANNPVRANSWADYLVLRVEKTFEKSYDILKADVENFDGLFKLWSKEVQRLRGLPAELVHGDFFPSNVIVDEVGGIQALIDFSPLTVLGDWRMDVVGAYIYLEVVDTYKPEQSTILRKIIDTRLGDTVSDDLINLYRVYYSLYFSYAKSHDANLYKWCVDNLNDVKP